MRQMRQVINGKLYDSGKSTLIASNCSRPNSFSDIDEGLYQTKNGNWFLAGEGGSLTRYAKDVPGNEDCRQSGSGIRALTEQEARVWCEQHDVDAETIEDYFSIDEA